MPATVKKVVSGSAPNSAFHSFAGLDFCGQLRVKKVSLSHLKESARGSGNNDHESGLVAASRSRCFHS